MEVRRRILIVNRQGLHARPCTSIVTAALDFESELRIRFGSREVNGKSIIELMTLSAGVGAEVEVRSWGGDAPALVAAIEELFANGFGEEIEIREDE